MRKAITWTNADPVHRRIYKARGGDESIRQLMQQVVHRHHGQCAQNCQFPGHISSCISHTIHRHIDWRLPNNLPQPHLTPPHPTPPPPHPNTEPKNQSCSYLIIKKISTFVARYSYTWVCGTLGHAFDAITRNKRQLFIIACHWEESWNAWCNLYFIMKWSFYTVPSTLIFVQWWIPTTNSNAFPSEQWIFASPSLLWKHKPAI